MHEQIITKVLDRASEFLQDSLVQQLRVILYEELYACKIEPACTAIAVLDDMPEKIKLFLASKRLDGMSINTVRNYHYLLKRFSDTMRKDVSQVTSMDIRMYLAHIARRGLKNNTLATNISTLKSFFNFLEGEEFIIKSPLRVIKTTKVEKRVRKALSREELEMLRDACKTLREKALVEIFYSTGCRLDEIQKLDKGEVNWASGSMMVIGKGNKEREVYLNARAMFHLKKYLNSRTDSNPALFVCGKRPYNRLGRRSIEIEFSEIGKRAEIQKSVYPHLVRHTTATNMLQGGASLTEVQNLLGHDSPATTQIYAHLSTEAVKQSHSKHMA